MKYLLPNGQTDYSAQVFIQDSSLSNGGPLTGLTAGSSGLTCYYSRPKSVPVAIVLNALSAVTAAHSDGGFIAVDGTNMPGWYRLDYPDAVLAAAQNVHSVGVHLRGAANMVPVPMEVALVSFNPFDSVRMGMTALPNAAADAAGGLPISDAGGLDLDAQVGTKINDILTDTGTTLQAEIDGVQADTEDIQARLPDALVGGNLKAVVQAMGTGVLTADAIAANAITSSELDTSAVEEIRDAILAAVIETGVDLRDSLAYILAANAGILAGAATTTITIRDVNDAADRLVATVDADGNRTAVVLTPP